MVNENITSRTRPRSVQVTTAAARKQVERTVAALAHHEQDNDSVSQARAAEALFSLDIVLELDTALEDFRRELDNLRKTVQDRFYGLDDKVKDMRPDKPHVYTPITAKGTTHNVKPQGQAKQQGSKAAASVSSR